MKSIFLLFMFMVLVGGCGQGSGLSEVPQQEVRTLAGVASQVPDSPQAYHRVVQQIYVAYFGRPADALGLAYQSDLLAKAGASTDLAGLLESSASRADIASVLEAFWASQEATELYGGDVERFVDAVYNNLFNRPAEAAGKAYWADLMRRGVMPKASAVMLIMMGAQGNDAKSVEKKVLMASKFTDSLNSDAKVNAYSGIAGEYVRSMLSQVGASTDDSAITTMSADLISKLLYLSPSSPGSFSFFQGTTYIVTPTGDFWARGTGPVGDGSKSGFADSAFRKVGIGYKKVLRNAASIALTLDGTVLTWGQAQFGQIGDGTATPGRACKNFCVKRGHEIIPKGICHDRYDDHEKAAQKERTIPIPS